MIFGRHFMPSLFGLRLLSRGPQASAFPSPVAFAQTMPPAAAPHAIELPPELTAAEQDDADWRNVGSRAIRLRERARIDAIARPHVGTSLFPAATALACDTNMSPDEAGAVLTAMQRPMPPPPAGDERPRYRREAE